MAVDTEASRPTRVLQEIRDDFVAGEATQRSKQGKALDEERLFVADSNLFNDVSDNLNILLENPTADKNIIITGIATLGDTQGVAELLRNPDSNAPTTSASVRNLIFAPEGTGDTDVPASDMNLFAETNANQMGAGTGEATGIEITILNGFNVRSYTSVIPPGQSLGVGVPAGGVLGTSFDLKLSIFFFEQAV